MLNLGSAAAGAARGGAEEGVRRGEGSRGGAAADPPHARGCLLALTHRTPWPRSRPAGRGRGGGKPSWVAWAEVQASSRAAGEGSKRRARLVAAGREAGGKPGCCRARRDTPNRTGLRGAGLESCWGAPERGQSRCLVAKASAGGSCALSDAKNQANCSSTALGRAPVPAIKRGCVWARPAPPSAAPPRSCPASGPPTAVHPLCS